MSRRSYAGLAAVGLGVSLPTFDLAVNVAFPAITEAFALDTPGIRWVVACYVVTYASLMLGFGRLGDVIGYRRVFRLGVVASAIAFVLCGAATDYAWLLAARVLQGVGAALVFSCAPALATGFFEEERRTWALSAYAMMSAAAGVLAPVLGGAAIAWMGWSGVFWFRLPVALATLAVLAFVPATRDAPVPQPYDRPAAALLACGLAALLLAPVLLQSGADFGGGAALLALAGAGLLAAFAARQRSAPHPLLPPAALALPGFAATNLASVAVHLAAFAVPLFVPYWLSRIAGLPPAGIGIVLAASPLGILAGSALAPGLMRGLRRRGAAWLGGMVLAASQYAIGTWDATTGAWTCAAVLAIHGAGIGLFQVAYADSVIEALPQRHRGVAGSLTVLTRTLGVMAGVTSLTALLHGLETSQLGRGVAPVEAFLGAFGPVFRQSAGAFGIAFALLAAPRTALR